MIWSGKWHGGGHLEGQIPARRGFDRSRVFLNGNEDHFSHYFGIDDGSCAVYIHTVDVKRVVLRRRSSALLTMLVCAFPRRKGFDMFQDDANLYDNTTYGGCVTASTEMR